MFSALYTGATGMKTHSQGMQVLGNNISNVNTTGFKNAQIRFADLVSDNAVTGSTAVSGVSQVGLGVSVNDVVTSFKNGGLETTNESTDVAISGKGFFKVVDPGDGSEFYTRAGNFRFDYEGYLLDTNGYRVQGKVLDGNGVETPDAVTNIRLRAESNGTFTQVAKATETVTLVSNLGVDRVEDGGVSFQSMLENYDGLSEAPLTEAQYGYKDDITVYDSSGGSRTLSVYYADTGVSNADGGRVVGYMVGIDPAQDGSALAGTSSAGLLMGGTLTFDSKGDLVGQTGYTYASGDPADLSNWTLAALRTGGGPEFTATFESGATMTAAFNHGLNSTTGQWSATSTLASAVQPDIATLPTFESERAPQYTTAYGTTASTTFEDQDGYPMGTLTRVEFTQDGILTGHYSNGQTSDLYQLTLYDFTNEYGLHREGGNLFATSSTTGEVSEGVPNSGKYGSVSGNSLELSNVDLAREFVGMITTQRGFQANTKIITTSDSLLQTAINLKR